MMKKWQACICLILALMLPLTALAEAADAPAIQRKGLTLGEGYVYYPQVEGLADETLTASVNARVLEELGVAGYLDRLAVTMQSPTPLTVDYSARLKGDVLSLQMLASGPVKGTRSTQVWTTTNIDLRTGEAIGWEQLFTDPDAAKARIAEHLDYEVVPELSAHLSNCEVNPLPDTFTLSDTALTLHYPIGQLSTLSDRAAVIAVRWSVVSDLLRAEPDGIPARIGALASVTPDATTRQRIIDAVAEGSLPGVPAHLGDSVQEWVDRSGLLVDPDLYEGGRLIQLEDGAFRGVYLLTDNLTDDFDTSIVQGLRADSIDLCGISTGKTTREEAIALLGQPDASVTMDAERAEAYRLPVGVSDYFDLETCQLRLHAGEDGVVVSVFLTK